MTSCIALLLPFALAAQFAGPALAPPAQRNIDAARLERLRVWLAAIEQHQPGGDDPAARRIAMWPRADLDQVRLDLRPVLILMRRPSASAFQTESSSGIPLMIVYGQRELDELRDIAAGAARRGDVNRVLKRGAMLHTDIALFVPLDGRETPSATSFTLHFMDGRPLSLSDAVGHWAMARGLLDTVAPDPARDEMVRLWYGATAAYFIAAAQLDTDHFARATALFPRDADILLLAGAFHETLAAPAVHDVMDSARLPDGAKFRIGSARDELRLAEALLERALRIDPDLSEARIRLGHVLGQLGRPADAIQHLTRAKSRIGDPMLRYYAELFLGRESDAAGRRNEAVTAYERASALFPAAQSPRLALSELAARSGEQSVAALAVGAMLTRPSDEGADPWWSYNSAAGRSAPARLRELLAMFATDHATPPSGAPTR
jgi:tetratricopeptide (TPR) repeat protein